jgi:hypothetical protein
LEASSERDIRRITKAQRALFRANEKDLNEFIKNRVTAGQVELKNVEENQAAIVSAISSGIDAEIKQRARLMKAEAVMAAQRKAQAQAELDARRAIAAAVLALTQETLAIFIDLAGQESALGKALLVAKQGFAIAEVVQNTAVANSSSVAASPLTAGQPWVGINTASAAVSIAKIVAETAKALSVSAAAGGGEFMTTKPTLLLVGDNPGGRERVSVTPVSGRGQTTVAPNSGLVRMGGGALMAGAETSNAISAGARQANDTARQNAMLAMAIAGMQPVVSVKEIARVNNRVRAKESKL